MTPKTSNLLIVVPKVLGFVIVFALAAWPGNVVGDDEATAEIAKSWAARSAKIQSLSVRWDVTTTFLEGGLTSQATVFADPKGPLAAKIKNGFKVPKQDVVVKTRHELRMIGESARYDFETIMWSKDPDPVPTVKPRKCVSLDGKSKTYDPDGLGEGTTPTGQALDKMIRDLFEPDAFPLILHYLPDSENYGRYSIKRKSFAAVESQVNDKVVTLIATRKGQAGPIRIQCDRSRSGVITSIVHLDKSGTRTLSFEIEYQTDPTIGAFPRKWTAIQYDILSPGRLLKQIVAEVVTYEINSLVDKEALKFEFDKGTIVFGREGPGIVGADGKQIQLTTADMGRPYEELREMAERQPKTKWRYAIPAAIVLIVGFTLTTLAVRRRRNSRLQSQPGEGKDSANSNQ